MKRFFALLLTFLLCLPLLVACKGDGETEESGTDAGTPLSVIANDASEYAIVYPSADTELTAAAYSVGRMLQKTIESATGVELVLQDDQKGAREKEILIGPVTRDGVGAAPVSPETYQLGYSAYMWGNKIVLSGGSETGLRLAAYALIRELLGLDLLSDPKVPVLTDRTEFSVSSVFSATETLVTEKMPFIGVPLEDFGVCFDDGAYSEKRAAIILQQEIKDVDGVVLERVAKAWEEKDGAYFYFETDETLAGGTFRIRTEGKRIILSAKDYYGFNAAGRTVMEMRSDYGFYPFRETQENTGDHLDTLRSLEASAKYAFHNSSEHRVMFYNVLWGTSIERSILQSEMVKAYSPDVIGFQEMKEDRRSGIVPVLLKSGYAEAMDYKEGNMKSEKYGTGTDKDLYNYVPIFYKTATTKCIESGYLRYKAQYSESESASKSLSWAVLESKNGGDRYIVLNTHMCTQDDDIRRSQAREAVVVANELLSRYDVPVFLGGDYNGTYGAANYLYFAVTGGFTDIEKDNLATEYTSKIKSFHRGFPSYRNNLGLMWPADDDDTGVNPAGSVDHIMIKNREDVTVSVYGVVVDDYTMSGGDHYPIFADFSIN